MRTWTYELDTVERAEAKGEKRIVVSVKRLRATLEAARDAADRQREADTRNVCGDSCRRAIRRTPLVTEFEP